jgi:hypothetical protein
LIGGLSSSNIDGTYVETANDVEQRENALENFVTEGAKSFFQERSLNLDMATAA